MTLPSNIANLLPENRIPSKIKAGKCGVPYCPKERVCTDPICPRCRKRLTKHLDPVRYTYDATKANARRRKKPFTITLEYFRKFCEESGYIEGKGRTKEKLTIDCEKNHLGYIEGNIRVLSCSLNASKGDRDEYPF